MASNSASSAPERRERIGTWSSPEAKQRFDELYASVRDRSWGSTQNDLVSPIEHDIEGRFGTTRVFEWPGPGAPLVLLHGMNATSAMWAPLISRLQGRRHLIALDTMGDPNASHQSAPAPTVTDLADWVHETTAAMGIERYHLAGTSYGGWLALHAAATTINPPASLVLVEPIIDQLRPMFFIHGITAALFIRLPGPGRRWAARHFHVGALADRQLATMGRLAFTRYRRGLPKPHPVTDEQLQAIDIPTLTVIGARSPIHRPREIANRIRAALPNTQIELLDNAGHGLAYDEPDRITPLLEVFLDQIEANGPHPTA